MHKKIFITSDFRIRLITNSERIMRLVENYLDFGEGKFPGSKITLTFKINESKLKYPRNEGKSLYRGYFLKEIKIFPAFGERSAEVEINPKINFAQATIFQYQDSLKERFLEFIFLRPLRIILAHNGFFPLHASLVEKGNTCIVIAGKGSSGKSTLAFILSQNGFRLLADDDSFIKVARGRVLLFPFPTKMGLRNKMFMERHGLGKYVVKNYHFGEKPRVSLKHIYASRERNYYRNKLLLFPKYHQKKGLRLEQITKKQATINLAKDNIDLFFKKENQELAIQHFWALYALTKEARCFELFYNDEALKHFPEMILRCQATSKT